MAVAYIKLEIDCSLWRNKKLDYLENKTRQSVAVQREGGIPVGKKILHPYQGP